MINRRDKEATEALLKERGFLVSPGGSPAQLLQEEIPINLTVETREDSGGLGYHPEYGRRLKP